MLLYNLNRDKVNAAHAAESRAASPDEALALERIAPPNEASLSMLSKEEPEPAQVIIPNPTLPIVRALQKTVRNFVKADRSQSIGFHSTGASAPAKKMLNSFQNAIGALTQIIDDRKDMSPQDIVHKVDAINIRTQITEFISGMTNGNPFGSEPPAHSKSNVRQAMKFSSKLDVTLLQLDAREAGIKVNVA